MFYKFLKPVTLFLALNILCSHAFAAPNISKFIKDDVLFDKNSANTSYSPDDEVTFIVEVSGDPVFAQKQAEFYSEEAMAEYEEGMLEFQSEIIDSISASIDTDVEKGYTYTSLFNGFSIKAKYSELESLKQIDGVKNVYISEEHEPVRPYLETSSEQINTPYAYDTLEYSGEGQVIAILDSEFDTAHDFFSSEVSNPTYTKNDIEDLVDKKAFNISASAQQLYKSSKIPFAYDYGCSDADTFDNTPKNIHGTHVAGIAGGKNGLLPNGETVFSGIAPECQLVLMKITKANGNLSDDAILAALNDVAKLNVDSINMSFGSKYVSSAISSLYAANLKVLKNAGVFISTSAGNESRGFYDAIPAPENIDYSASGIPTSYESVFSVASANNTQRITSAGKLTLNDGTVVTATPAFASSAFFTNLSGKAYEYVYCAHGTALELCGEDLSGKIALVERGYCTFSEKATNVKLSGAVGMILWNDSDEYISTVDLSLPTAVITHSDGQLLFDAQEKQVTVSPLSATPIVSPSHGQISSFSSWGTSDNLDLKPEITAPGGYIYSSVPDNKYTTMSGTSMSSPHIAGAMALMNQYYESHPFADTYNDFENADKVNLLSNLVMSSADVIKKDGIPSSPRVQGAGMINLKKAMQTPVVLIGSDNKTKINLGESLQESFTLTFKAKNLSDKDVTFNSLSLDVTTDGYTVSDGEYLVGDTKKLTFSDNHNESITVAANSEQEISVTVTLDKSELDENMEIFKNGFFIDGFVYLTASDENAVNLNIPFTGFYGDWEAVPIFDTTMYDEGGSSLYQKENSKATGTFLFTDYSEGYMPLGANIFDSTVNPDFIAISPNGDGYFDEFNLNIQTYRTYKPTLTIYNSKGKFVKGVIYNQLSKFHVYSLDYFADMMSTFADGDYTLKVDGTYSTSSVVNDSFTLPFTIDREAPKIEYVTPDRANGKIYISASDNHGIQGISIFYPDTDGKITGQVAPISDSLKKQATAVFNVPSHVSYDDILTEVCDYAFNVSSSPAMKYAFDLRATLVDSYSGNTTTILQYEIENACESSISATPVLSFFDEDMNLIKIHVPESITIGANTSKTFEFTIGQNLSSAKYVRILLWDSLSGMKPLSYPQ